MEKKVQGTKVWTLIAQTPDGGWMGFYRFGMGNNPHHNHAVDWSTGLTSNLRFYLLHRGFNPEDINALIRGTFDYQSTKEAAQATVGKDGRVKLLRQAVAEKKLEDHNSKQTWVDITLGMTKKQLEEYRNEQIALAKVSEGVNRGYNFDEEHSLKQDARQDDRTALSSTQNISMGDTAYNIVEENEDSDASDLMADPYNNNEGQMDFKMNQVHEDAGNSHLDGATPPHWDKEKPNDVRDPDLLIGIGDGGSGCTRLSSAMAVRRWLMVLSTVTRF